MNNAAFKTFIALLLACVAGVLSGPHTAIFGVPLIEIFGLIGDLFLNALSLIVVPLVASSIILGASRLGGDHSAGSLGAKTFSYFFLTTSMAVLAGYVIIIMMQPGVLESSTLPTSLDSNIQNIETIASGGGFVQIKQLLFKLLPSNILATASQGQMLGLILFCLLFGYFMMKIEKSASSTMLAFWTALFQIMMKMTHFFMKAMPLGVFGLVARVIAASGLEAFHSLAWFFFAVLAAIAVYAGFLLPLLLKFVAGVNPLAHYSAMAPALLTGFSTSSSAASLPIVIECVEKRAGVSNRVCGFTVPLGTALSLSGSAMYTCMVVLFISQAYGVGLSLTTQLIVVVMAVVTSFGLAGIPSASLIAIVVILQSVGLPAEGIGLVLAIERILDMFRTATNVLGNSTCAILVAKSEGEIDVLASPQSSAVTMP